VVSPADQSGTEVDRRRGVAAFGKPGQGVMAQFRIDHGPAGAQGLAYNRHLGEAVQQWAFRSLQQSAWARQFYDEKTASGDGHHSALRKLGNRWLEVLWHCLDKGVLYDEAIHTANRQKARPATRPVHGRGVTWSRPVALVADGSRPGDQVPEGVVLAVAAAGLAAAGEGRGQRLAGGRLAGVLDSQPGRA
jgi:hypothetical protein